MKPDQTWNTGDDKVLDEDGDMDQDVVVPEFRGLQREKVSFARSSGKMVILSIERSIRHTDTRKQGTMHDSSL